MKLYYFNATQGNVGDDLNPWLMPRILGKSLDDDHEHLLIGIGTLLNHLIPLTRRYTVLSSGVGYGTLPNITTGKWDFVGVRGPLTKEKLNIKQPLCLLDGAYLMPRYFEAARNKKHKVAFIPHVDSITNGLWENVCEISGIKLIDPRLSVENFINELCSCEKVLTEAMHGAILADAYGVPWKPIKAYEYIDEFKWKDWAMSLNMDIEFSLIDSTWRGDRGASIKRKTINSIKRAGKYFGYFSKSWTPVLPSTSNKSHIEKVANSLILHSKSELYFNSNENLRNNRIDLLLEAIDKELSF